MNHPVDERNRNGKGKEEEKTELFKSPLTETSHEKSRLHFELYLVVCLVVCRCRK